MLTVWWRRLNATGALAGMISGFLATGFVLVDGSRGALALDPLTAAAAGVPLSFAVAILFSKLSRPPSEETLRAADDMRIPAGETLQARATRLASRTKLR
jgi:cation/acetate symporter